MVETLVNADGYSGEFTRRTLQMAPEKGLKESINESVFDENRGVNLYELKAELVPNTSLPMAQRIIQELPLQSSNIKSALCMAHALGKELRSKSCSVADQIVKNLPYLKADFSTPEKGGAYTVTFYQPNRSNTGYEEKPYAVVSITPEEDDELKMLASVYNDKYSAVDLSEVSETINPSIEAVRAVDGTGCRVRVVKKEEDSDKTDSNTSESVKDFFRLIKRSDNSLL
ncbi:MAG: hypothetical protein S4CHLAM37_11730 [Chlamydiia bacterium]|nr:hypothetical protein [Chlamydiia bacterium]